MEFNEADNLIVTDSYPAAWQLVLLGRGRASAVYGNEIIAKGICSSLGFQDSPCILVTALARSYTFI